MFCIIQFLLAQRQQINGDKEECISFSLSKVLFVGEHVIKHNISIPDLKYKDKFSSFVWLIWAVSWTIWNTPCLSSQKRGCFFLPRTRLSILLLTADGSSWMWILVVNSLKTHRSTPSSLHYLKRKSAPQPYVNYEQWPRISLGKSSRPYSPTPPLSRQLPRLLKCFFPGIRKKIPSGTAWVRMWLMCNSNYLEGNWLKYFLSRD